MGKPVFKRAKHGIHFKNNDGSITANFSGKPCHYLDGAVWRAIDTKLIRLSDGWYGSPHSGVRIHPDGRVKVEGYQQRAELPSAKVGKADNDKLIREFSFGSQELRITEDGFKSEITLNRIPTLAEARKLIASESGTLSKKYLKSLTTATDANGDVHVVTTLAAFRTWLAKAVFPVVIDPDFSLGSTSFGDFTFVGGGNATRNYGTATSTAPASGNELAAIMRFDLSSINSSSTCNATTLKLTRLNSSVNTRAMVVVSVASGNTSWIAGTKNGSIAGSGEPCWNALAADGAGGVTTAWAGSAGMSTSGTDYEATLLMERNVTSSDAQNGQISFDFNATGVARVEDWFGAVNTNYGMIFKAKTNAYGDVRVALSDNATESYRPILTVTYTAGGSITPIVQYYNRLRRN